MQTNFTALIRRLSRPRKALPILSILFNLNSSNTSFKQYMVFYFMHIMYSFLHTKHNSLHTNHKYMFSMYSSLHTFRQKSVIFKTFSLPKIQACFVHYKCERIFSKLLQKVWDIEEKQISVHVFMHSKHITWLNMCSSLFTMHSFLHTYLTIWKLISMHTFVYTMRTFMHTMHIFMYSMSINVFSMHNFMLHFLTE